MSFTDWPLILWIKIFWLNNPKRHKIYNKTSEVNRIYFHKSLTECFIKLKTSRWYLSCNFIFGFHLGTVDKYFQNAFSTHCNVIFLNNPLTINVRSTGQKWNQKCTKSLSLCLSVSLHVHLLGSWTSKSLKQLHLIPGRFLFISDMMASSLCRAIGILCT